MVLDAWTCASASKCAYWHVRLFVCLPPFVPRPPAAWLAERTGSPLAAVFRRPAQADSSNLVSQRERCYSLDLIPPTPCVWWSVATHTSLEIGAIIPYYAYAWHRHTFCFYAERHFNFVRTSAMQSKVQRATEIWNFSYKQPIDKRPDAPDVIDTDQRVMWDLAAWKWQSGWVVQLHRPRSSSSRGFQRLRTPYYHLAIQGAIFVNNFELQYMIVWMYSSLIALYVKSMRFTWK